jgi:DNA-binding NarL/FixJ family response regulator
MRAVATRRQMLRILIADDHEVARRGIHSLLESHAGWEVCAGKRRMAAKPSNWQLV